MRVTASDGQQVFNCLRCDAVRGGGEALLDEEQRTTAAGEFARLQHGHCHLAARVQQTSIRGDQWRLDGVGERRELAVGWIGHKAELFRMRRTAEPVRSETRPRYESMTTAGDQTAS